MERKTLMNSSSKQRRKIGVRTPLNREGRLTRRDLALMIALESFGGVLTTVQIALLFWALSLANKLKWWRLEKEIIEKLVAVFPAKYLDQYIELGKWLLRIRKDDPALFGALDLSLQRIAEVEPKVWLLQAIQESIELPEAFLSMPRLPSQWVSRACTSRLRFLLDLGLIDAHEQPSRLRDGRAQLLWYLSKQGRDWVAQLRNVEPKEVDWKPAGSFNPAFLNHRIKTNDFRICVTLAAERLDFDLSWVDDNELRRAFSHPSEKVTVTYPKDLRDPEGEVVEKKIAIIPDGFFSLSTGAKQFFNYIEIDTGSETGMSSDPGRKDWAYKIRGYTSLYLSGLYHRRHPEAGNSMRVLTLVPSEARRATLKEVTEKVVGQGKGLNRYWFAVFSDLAPTYEDFFNETVLTGKIWQIAGRDGLYSLVW
jgi:hypothetical protein